MGMNMSSRMVPIEKFIEKRNLRMYKCIMITVTGRTVEATEIIRTTITIAAGEILSIEVNIFILTKEVDIKDKINISEKKSQ
jgi:hypothetical protein